MTLESRDSIARSGPSQRLSFVHCFVKEHGKAASGGLAGHRGDGGETAEGEQAVERHR